MSCPYHNNSSSSSSSTPTPPNKPKTILDWWPEQLDLRILHQDVPSARPSHVPHPSSTNNNYTSYSTNFSKLNLPQLRNDIHAALTNTTKQHPAWPADYSHYGPLMVRLAWHSAGTYRTYDGRGGGNSANIRLAPLNSWPDNANLDKIRRYVLWPIKQKYGQLISWGDLIILAGNVAIESMMGTTDDDDDDVEPLWFGGGRIDAFASEEDVYWGNEGEWLKDDRHATTTGLEKPLGAVQMGLIYVNPEGPGGDPDILASAKDIRETFYRMGMNDEETVALIAGGHTFGKAHGAANADKHVGAEPEGADINEMGLGWKNSFGSGKGKDTITSGLEGAWTAKPTQWDNGYFDNLFRFEWEKTKSPGGAIQWVPDATSIAKNGGDSAVRNVPDAHDPSLKHLPITFTTLFKYLGTHVHFTLDETNDIEIRMNKANQALGAMRFFFKRPEVNLWTKYLIFRAIHINILLWGVESWAIHDNHIRKLQTWVDKAIRSIVGISMTQVQEERISEEDLWGRFHNIPSVQHTIVLRRMNFLGKVVQGSPEAPARLVLIAYVDNPRSRGRPITSTKASLIKSLQIFGEYNGGFKIDDTGSLKFWYREAMKPLFWEKCLERFKKRDPDDETPPQRPSRDGNPSEEHRHQYNTRSSAAPPPPPPPSPPPRNPPPSPPRERRDPPRSN